LTQLRWSMQNHRRFWTSSQTTTSRMHLKKMAESLGTVYACRWASRPKFSSWPDGCTSRGNCGYKFVYAENPSKTHWCDRTVSEHTCKILWRFHWKL
jgi:hypothetical protein